MPAPLEKQKKKRTKKKKAQTTPDLDDDDEVLVAAMQEVALERDILSTQFKGSCVWSKSFGQPVHSLRECKIEARYPTHS